MKMPEEIAEAVKQIWIKYLHPWNAGGIIIVEEDLLSMENGVMDGVSSYNPIFRKSDNIYGRTEDDRLKFWVNVISGDYELFFDKFPKFETIEINNQKYVI